MPDRELKPILALPGAGVIVVVVFDYQDTSIGPYTSVAIAVPVRYRRSTRVPLLPLLAERWLDDVGQYIQLLAVTTPIARDSAESGWGYPAFLAEVELHASDEHIHCSVSERGRSMMDIEIERPGALDRATMPLRTYSRKGDSLCFTESSIDGLVSIGRLGASASLRINPHPRVESLYELPITFNRPLEVRWFAEHRFQIDAPQQSYRIER